MGYEWLALCAAFFMGGFQPDFGYSCAASGCLFLQSLADGLHSRDFVDHGVDNRRLAKCVLGTHYADDGIRIDRDLHWRHRTVCLFESHGAKASGPVVFLPCRVFHHLRLFPV